MFIFMIKELEADWRVFVSVSVNVSVCVSVSGLGCWVSVYDDQMGGPVPMIGNPPEECSSLLPGGYKPGC